MSLSMTPEVKAVIESGRLAHFTTLSSDGRPHTTIVWLRTEDGEIVIGKLQPDQKVANIKRDPRVSISIEAEGAQYGMQNYLAIEGSENMAGSARAHYRAVWVAPIVTIQERCLAGPFAGRNRPQ